jgi:Domain of unknown function (DUF4249)
MKKNLIYFLFLTLLASCANSVLEIAPWNNTPVPVVFSILSPTEPVQLYLYRTWNENYPLVKNPYPEAKVYLCGVDSNWVELTRLSPDSTIFGDIQKKLNVEIGKTFFLKVVLSDRTIHAQTTVVPDPARITTANCVFTGKTQLSYIVGSFPDMKFDTVNINSLVIKYSATANRDYGYEFSSSSEMIWGTMLQNEGIFQTSNFVSGRDTTSVTIKLTTFDPTCYKYQKAQEINSLSSGYSYNSPVLALIQSFGGVLPKFSNIVNGVGLFGNSVTDSVRVVITAPNPSR